MNKELKALRMLEQVCLVANVANMKEQINLIEDALNDNYFYKHIISRTCGYMGLDINPSEDLIKTENAMIDYICENECFRADVAFYKERLKALEIIKKVSESDLRHFINTYIKDENERKLVKGVLL